MGERRAGCQGLEAQAGLHIAPFFGRNGRKLPQNRQHVLARARAVLISGKRHRSQICRRLRLVSTFTLIAKAGGSDEASENTCAALEAAVAVQLPPWAKLALEVDVRLSADGVPVVIHDARLERTTDGRGQVQELTLEQLRGLRAGRGGERVPSLEEVFDVVGERELVLDVHAGSAGSAECLLAALRRLGAPALSRVVVASEHASVVRSLRVQEPRLRTAATKPEAWRKLLLERVKLERWSPHGHTWMVPVVHRGLRVATPRFVASARHAGDDVWVYVVNDSAELLRLRNLGVTGCFTTRPAALARALVGSR